MYGAGAELRARLVNDRAGRSSLVGVSSDVTDRKIAEDYLKGLNETLEHRVRERTRELEQAHLTVLEEIGQGEKQRFAFQNTVSDKVLVRTGLPPNDLVLELTESVALTDLVESARVLSGPGVVAAASWDRTSLPPTVTSTSESLLRLCPETANNASCSAKLGPPPSSNRATRTGSRRSSAA